MKKNAAPLTATLHLEFNPPPAGRKVSVNTGGEKKATHYYSAKAHDWVPAKDGKTRALLYLAPEKGVRTPAMYVNAATDFRGYLRTFFHDGTPLEIAMSRDGEKKCLALYGCLTKFPVADAAPLGTFVLGETCKELEPAPWAEALAKDLLGLRR